MTRRHFELIVDIFKDLRKKNEIDPYILGTIENAFATEFEKNIANFNKDKFLRALYKKK